MLFLTERITVILSKLKKGNNMSKKILLPLGLLLVAFSLTLTVGYLLHSNNKSDSPMITYHLPDRTGNTEVNTGRSPYVTPRQVTSLSVESVEIVPPEDIQNLDDAEWEVLEYEICCDEEEVFEAPDTPDIKLAKARMPKNLGELLTNNGLSNSDIEDIQSVMPLDTSIPIDSTGKFVQHIFNIVQPIMDQFDRDVANTTVEEARAMIHLMNNDPTVTAEEYQAITYDLFPIHVQNALRQEGLIK